MKTVLIVEDSMYMRSLIRIALKKAGYEIIGEAEDGKTAIEMVNSLHPDIVTLDNILPDMLGIEVLKHIHDNHLSSDVVMVTAMGQHAFIDRSKMLKAKGYVAKPFESRELVDVINQVANKHKATA